MQRKRIKNELNHRRTTTTTSGNSKSENQSVAFLMGKAASRYRIFPLRDGNIHTRAQSQSFHIILALACAYCSQLYTFLSDTSKCTTQHNIERKLQSFFPSPASCVFFPMFCFFTFSQIRFLFSSFVHSPNKFTFHVMNNNNVYA